MFSGRVQRTCYPISTGADATAAPALMRSHNSWQYTMQIIAEKRGLNYYTSKDNFYSIKIKLETLVIRAKIRLKAQF